MSTFGYPVSRAITLRYFTRTFFVFGIIWIIIITIINVVVVGYETVPVTSTAFYSANKLWYEGFSLGTYYVSRTCNATIVKMHEGSRREDAEDSLELVIDETNNGPVDGMLYADYSLNNCSVQNLQMSQWVSSVSQDMVTVYCNTSAGQFLSATTSRNNIDPLLAGYQVSTGNQDNTLLRQWVLVQSSLLQWMFPFNQQSPFQLSVQRNNLSNIQLSYKEYLTSTNESLITNSPAQDSWAIEIDTVPITGPPSNSPLYISFLPNGSIDGSQTKPADLEKATTLLEPTIAYLHNQTTQQFDYWELINWLYVSFYWTVLADLGQIAPTIYLNGNLSLPITLPSTNNIFTNVTLFNRYSLYLQHTVLPILGMTDSGIVIPSFDQSSMELPRMTFIQSYSCMERHLKTPLEFLISVVVADYALIMGGYNLAIFIAAMVQRRRNRDGNFCEGCLSKLEDGGGLGSEMTVPLQTYRRESVGEI